jgi:peptidase C39-like protein
MNSLKFPIEPQKCSEWCWAAVTAGVCNCYGDSTPTRQCEVANLVLQLPIDNCTECDCQQDPSAPCNQPRNLAAVLDTVHHDRGNPTDGIPTLQFEDVKSDIDNGRPIVVQVTLDDPAASGHAVAIYGYTDEGMVSIADPMHPDDQISVRFADFVAGGQTDLHGTWKAAYRTKGINE